MSFDYRNSRLALAGGLLVMMAGALGIGCVVEQQPLGFPYPTEDSFCQALAEVQCSASVVDACYGSGSDPAAVSADTESCVTAASRRSLCNPDGRSYHPETAESCLLQQQDAYRDATLTRTEQLDVAEACIAVFSKDGRVGDGCLVDADCNTGDGLRCITKIGDESGACFRPTQVNAGDKCSDQTAVCKEGYHCDDGGHCVSNPELNEACGVAQPCAAGFFCSNDVCSAQASNASPCVAAEECSGGFCLTNSSGDDGHCAAASEFNSFSSNCDQFR